MFRTVMLTLLAAACVLAPPPCTGSATHADAALPAPGANPFKGQYNWLIYYDPWTEWYIYASIKVFPQGAVQGKVYTNFHGGHQLVGTSSGTVSVSGAVSVTGVPGYAPPVTGSAILDPEANMVITTPTGVITWHRLH